MRADISRELALFRQPASDPRPRGLHKTTQQHEIRRTNKMKTTTINTSYSPLLLLSLILALSTSTGVARAFAPAVARKSAKSGSDVDTAELLKQPLSGLLDQYATEVAAMKSTTRGVVGDKQFKMLPYNNDIFYLQFCLDSPLDHMKAMQHLKTSLEWRTSGKGKIISDAAVVAVQQIPPSSPVTAPWGDREGPVFAEAPHASKICRHLNPSNLLTTTASNGDLVYCIRARDVHLPELKKDASLEELKDFFLYLREVHSLTSLRSSLELNRWVRLVTANDLGGAKLVGGGQKHFAQAFSEFNDVARSVYPSVTDGPIILLNMPRLLTGIVNFMTPESLKDRIKFDNGLFQDVKQLVEVAVTAEGERRRAFLRDVDKILFGNQA